MINHTMRRAVLTLAIAALALTACQGSQAQPTPMPSGHLIFHNGVVLTMEPGLPQVEAIALRGGLVEAVGSNAEILALESPASHVVDLDGLTLMPGFVDAHTHLLNDADGALGLDLEEAQELALANGITTLGNLYTDRGFLRQMQKLDKQGKLRVRTSLYLVATDNCGKPQGDWYSDYPPTRSPGEMLRIGGIKIFTDGGTCGRPALSYELPGQPGLGDLFLDQATLDSLVAEAQAAGYQVAIHAIGDRAVEQAQNAIAAALAGQPNTLRHRIEHNSVIRPDLLPRYGEIGIVPVIMGQYPVCHPFGPYPDSAYQDWEWPWPALMAANPELPVAWHGDDPYVGAISPLVELWAMVTRQDMDADGTICQPPDWLRAGVLTPQEALPTMTTGSAYALDRDQEVGSLTAGKYADLIILSGDPLSVDADAIKDLQVLMTMVGGRVEFCAEGVGICSGIE